jgi:hypothetical protein
VSRYRGIIDAGKNCMYFEDNVALPEGVQKEKENIYKKIPMFLHHGTCIWF